MTDAELLESYKRKVAYFARQATMWRQKARALEKSIKRGGNFSDLELWILKLIHRRGPLSKKELRINHLKSDGCQPADLSNSTTRLAGRGYLIMDDEGPYKGRYRATSKCRAAVC
jgi:hypothetical protein